MLKRVRRIAALGEEALTSALLLVIVILVFIAALTRYLGSPINWSVDIAQALFVWVVFIGANQAMRSSGHIGVSLVTDRLPPVTRTLIEIGVGLIVAMFFIAIIVYGIQVSIVNYGRILQSLPVSYSFVTLAVPCGALLMLITTVQGIVANVQTLRGGAGNDSSAV